MTKQTYKELVNKNEIDEIGSEPNFWFGVPLNVDNNYTGILVIQNYNQQYELNNSEMDWLSSISNLVASAIARKLNEEKLLKNMISVENAALGIFWMDSNGYLIYVNHQVERELLYSKDELLKMNINQIDPLLESGEINWKEIIEPIRNGETFCAESFHKRKDNSMFPVEITSRMLNFEGKEIFIAYVNNITKRSQAFDELKNSQYKFHKLIENSTLGIIRLNENGEIIMANPAFVNMLGYSSDKEIILKNTEKIFTSPKNRNKFFQTLKKNDQVSGYDDVLINSSDNLIDVRQSAWAIRDKEEKIIYYEVIVEDITEQNQVLKVLHESEFKYRMLIDKLTEAIFLTIDDKLEVANTAFLELFEITEEQLYLPNFTIKNFMSADSIHLINERDEKLKNGEEVPKIFEITIITRSGKFKEVEMSVSYLTFNGKNAVQGVIRDLTHIKMQETQLRHLQKMEAIGTLAAGIAHEINTPSQFINDNLSFLKDAYNELSPILLELNKLDKNNGTVEKLKEMKSLSDIEYLTNEIPVAVNQSIDGINRIAQIVGAMRDFAHSGPKDKVTADLHKIINNSITLSKNAWKYTSVIETDFDENLPTIICQPNDLNQVFVNMIVNASHAIEEKYSGNNEIIGKIKIKSKLIDKKVQITFQDNGSGMSEKVQERIFDPFFTTKEVGKGTGQGLAIAYDIIVTKHNGNIKVISEIGIGSKFLITLPLDNNEQ